MACPAVHAVQLEFVVERSDEAMKRSSRSNAHVLDVLEHHVILHHLYGGFDFLVGKSPAVS